MIKPKKQKMFSFFWLVMIIDMIDQRVATTKKKKNWNNFHIWYLNKVMVMDKFLMFFIFKRKKKILPIIAWFESFQINKVISFFFVCLFQFFFQNQNPIYFTKSNRIKKTFNNKKTVDIDFFSWRYFMIICFKVVFYDDHHYNDDHYDRFIEYSKN